MCKCDRAAFDKFLYCIVVVSTLKQTQGQSVKADVQHLYDAFVCSQNELHSNLIIYSHYQHF